MKRSMTHNTGMMLTSQTVKTEKTEKTDKTENTEETGGTENTMKTEDTEYMEVKKDTGYQDKEKTVKTENGTGRNITKTVNMQMINTPKYSKYLMTNSVEICGATEMIMIVGQIREIIHYY